MASTTPVNGLSHRIYIKQYSGEVTEEATTIRYNRFTLGREGNDARQGKHRETDARRV